jgi:nitroreductase
MEGTSFLALAKARKTTYEFSSKGVSSADIKLILEAARWSPSCSNTQPWYFVVVKDKKSISRMMGAASYGAFHYDPPLIIALVLNRDCWENADHRCVKDSKLGMYEAYLCIAMPALSMIFEAQELGIDSAMLTPKQEDISAILKTASTDSVPLMIALGYEKKGAFQKKRVRKNISELAFSEQFGRQLNI